MVSAVLGRGTAKAIGRLDEIEARATTATPRPWFYNGYSQIQAPDLFEAEEAAPGYPDKPRPGPPFFTDEDNAWRDQRDAAYEADSTVAWVPAHHGDTAIGRHAADADFLAHCRDDVPWLVARVRKLEAFVRSFAELDTNAGLMATSAGPPAEYTEWRPMHWKLEPSAIEEARRLIAEGNDEPA